MGLTNDIIPQNKAFINIKRSYGAGAQRSSLSLSSQYGACTSFHAPREHWSIGA